jgi:hypothetical protein
MPIRAAYIALSSSTFPTWIAVTKDSFEQPSLDAQFSHLQSRSTVLPALAARNLEEAQPAISVQAQRKGRDTVVLPKQYPLSSLRIVALAEIKTMEGRVCELLT